MVESWQKSVGDSVRFALVLVITLLVFGSIYLLKYSWFQSISFGLKIGLTIIIDRLISLLLFALKCCLRYTYDMRFSLVETLYWVHSTQTDGIPFFLSSGICLNAIIFFVGFKIPFFFGLICIICSSILEIWFISLCYQICRRLKRKQKVILRGKVPPISQQNKDEFAKENFRITDQIIGFGNFGTVYKCEQKVCVNGEDRSLPMAIKVIDTKLLMRNRAFNPRQEEFETINRKFIEIQRKFLELRHNSIANTEKVRIIQRDRIGTQIYLFTKLADMNLDYYLSHHKPNGVSKECAKNWFRQLTEAVYYLHRVFNLQEALPHSNIKPENVLLYRNSTYESKNNENGFDVKLSDCGHFLFLPLLETIVTKYKPFYFISPPNTVNGKKNLRLITNWPLKDSLYDRCLADIYNLGVILVLLIGGDIKNLVKDPKDTQIIRQHISEVVGIYVPFLIEDVKPLLGNNINESPNLKLLWNLIKQLINRKPHLRGNISKIKDHPWIRLDQ